MEEGICDLIWGTILVIFLEELRRTIKKTVRIGTVLAEIPTGHFLNRRWKHYHFSQYAEDIPLSSCLIYIQGISVISDERWILQRKFWNFMQTYNDVVVKSKHEYSPQHDYRRNTELQVDLLSQSHYKGTWSSYTNMTSIWWKIQDFNSYKTPIFIMLQILMDVCHAWY